MKKKTEKKKKGALGYLALIGTAAAAAAAVYSRREELRALIRNAAERFLPADDAPDEAEPWEENDDTEIVIDRSSATEGTDGAADKQPEETAAD